MQETENGKRKRSLGSARDDDTRMRFPHVSFHPAAEANLRPFGAPPSNGRREHTHYLPHKSLPRLGKVASEARRIGCWRYENEREKASQVSEMRTPLPSHSLSSRCGSQPPPLRGTSFQRKEGAMRESPFPQRGYKKAQPMRATLSDFKNYTLKRK